MRTRIQSFPKLSPFLVSRLARGSCDGRGLNLRDSPLDLLLRRVVVGGGVVRVRAYLLPLPLLVSQASWGDGRGLRFKTLLSLTLLSDDCKLFSVCFVFKSMIIPSTFVYHLFE